MNRARCESSRTQLTRHRQELPVTKKPFKKGETGLPLSSLLSLSPSLSSHTATRPLSRPTPLPALAIPPSNDP